MNIGFQANALVNLTNEIGTKIKDVVKNKMCDSVWTYNMDTGCFESKTVVGWNCFENRDAMANCVHIETVGVDGARGRFGFTATPNQQVMTDIGWKCVW